MAFIPGEENEKEVIDQVEAVVVEEVIEECEPQQNTRRRYENTRQNTRDRNAPNFSRNTYNAEPVNRGGTVQNRSFMLRNKAGSANTFKKKFDEISKTSEGMLSSLVVVDSYSSGISVIKDIGCLILVTPIDNDIYWHPILIESNEHPVRENLASQRQRRGIFTEDNLEIIQYRSTYDGINESDKFISKLEEYVKSCFPSSQCYVFTEVTIVPSEVDIENDEIVRNITFISEDANMTCANADAPYSPNNVSPRTSIIGTARFNQERIKYDILDQPYRADFSIDVSAKDRDSGSDILLESNVDSLLVTVDGFVTAAYVGVDEFAYNNTGRVNTACFMPEIAITNINTYHDVVDGQFDRGVLALATLPFINSDDYWMRQFEQTFGNADKSRKLSGFLYGMTVFDDKPLPDDMDLIDEDPKVRSYWMRNIFVEGSADVCIMVKDGGVDFTMGSLLRNIGYNAPEAFNRLIASINEISGNRFAEICEDYGYVPSCEGIVPKMVRVPTGYFKSNEGNQPIEMVDTLYMLNAIKANTPDLVDDWNLTTTYETQMEEDEALTRLIRVFEEVTGKLFVLKGFVTKVYLGGPFLKTVFSAVERGPLAIRMEADTGSSFARSRRRRPGRIERRNGLESDLAHSRNSDSYSNTSRRRSYSGASYR